jgi:threonine dehydrogenase-like Zn-dependent dehydrogenase
MGFQGVLGHEFVGEVLEADDRQWIGRRIVADINAGCGTCVRCLESDGHHCEARTVLGIAGRDGALAQELVVPERCLVAVPDTVSDEDAVFAEPLAAALHVLDEVRQPCRALVLGDGKLGLLVARVLLHAGFDVTLEGHHSDKLALLAQDGARTRLAHDASAAERFPLVVEATGSASGAARALALVEPRGIVVQKTTVASPVALDLSRLVVDELRLIGSRCGDLRRAVGLLEHAPPPLADLVSARYPLAEADRALCHAGQRGTLKVLVEGAVR